MGLIKHLLLEITDAKREALFKIFDLKYTQKYGNPAHAFYVFIYKKISEAIDKAEKTDSIDMDFLKEFVFPNNPFLKNQNTDNLIELHRGKRLDIYLSLLYVLLSNISVYINLNISTFELILSIDPTPNNSYTQWLLKILENDRYLMTLYTMGLKFNEYKQYGIMKYEYENKHNMFFSLFDYGFTKNGSDKGYYLGTVNGVTVILIEDREKFKQLLEKYDQYKKKNNFPQEFKDINKIKSFNELFEIIEDYEGSYINVYEKIQNEIKVGTIKKNIDYKILGEDDEWLIINPKSENGACAVGFKTNWCTSFGELSRDPDKKKNTNHYTTYKSSILISFIHKKSHKKNIQIQPKKDEYRDYKDVPIGIDGVRRNLTGKALEIFEKVIKKYESD